MKHVTLLLLFLAFVASTPIAAQEPEEEAVRKVIESETAAINLCDFDKWADHWWHEPYAFWSITWPNQHVGLSGWNDIAAWGKRTTADCTPNETPVKKYDYKYKISGAMAFVTFLEGQGNESTRVLEKRNGQWKLIRMGVIGTPTYKGLAQRQEMARMAGHWQADLSSLNYEIPVQFEVTELTLECQPTASGMTITANWRRRQAGNSWGNTSKEEVAYDVNSGEMGAFVVGNWTGGFSSTNLGKATYEDGVLKIKSTPISDSSGGYDQNEYFWKADSILHMRTVSYDADGKPQFAEEVDFRRNN